MMIFVEITTFKKEIKLLSLLMWSKAILKNVDTNKKKFRDVTSLYDMSAAC